MGLTGHCSDTVWSLHPRYRINSQVVPCRNRESILNLCILPVPIKHWNPCLKDRENSAFAPAFMLYEVRCSYEL